MKDRREFTIAMVLVGLVGVNFFYLAVIFFLGLHDALFRWTVQPLLPWMPAMFIIVSNLVALVGLFNLVRPRAGGATDSKAMRLDPHYPFPTRHAS